jgi:hypothetical protein
VSKELYHLSFEGAEYADTTIPMGRHVPGEGIFTLEISDGDDRPIEIGGVVARYYADELVFEGASSGSYTLTFGSARNVAAPVYDIARYSDEILRGEIDRLTLGEILYEAPEETEPQRDYAAVFNAVIIAVAVLLGAVLLSKLRKQK